MINNSLYFILLLLLSITSFSSIKFANLDYFIEAETNDSKNSNIISHQTSINKTEAVLQRGNIAMGFDQDKITHKFIPTVNGGEIIIMPLNASDVNIIIQIKEHIKDIQNDFSNGNFTKPFVIHAEQVPGTKIMNEKKYLIEYDIKHNNNNSILVMSTKDKEVIDAISDFMNFQGSEHVGH
ncbi:MAG: hypothetical protein H0X03_03660 [Nitrosopumilus sp.]|nr:hypothetical protein [Nitrosopumilus sp.]